MSPKPTLSGTDLLHGDHDVPKGLEVSPAISVSTTFRAPRPWSEDDGLKDLDPWNPERHVYSRYTQDVSTRAEKILSKINQGYALTYASGLASAYAAVVHLAPKRIAITGGYHGCHMVIEMYQNSRQERFSSLT
ncbi:hypothetical protein QCA50_000113 [Cerrena zonata]|uniref:Uncharacterized protein n=1 Tax=Cerrena zonata TaxID=2478898 RepID=A0AAW0GTU6_9APHY